MPDYKVCGRVDIYSEVLISCNDVDDAKEKAQEGLRKAGLRLCRRFGDLRNVYVTDVVEIM